MNSENNNTVHTIDDSEVIPTLDFRSDATQQDVLDISQLLPDSGVNSSNLKQFVKISSSGVFVDSSGAGQFSSDSLVARFVAGNPPLNAIIAVQIADTSVIHFDRSVTADDPLVDDVSLDTGLNEVTGTSQQDTLVGSAAADVIYGGRGDDVLEGGAGNDVYIGGSGADRYVLDDSDSVEILDFISTRFEKDVLDVSQLLPEGVDASNLGAFLKVTESGVFVDESGLGDFSEDNLVARFTEESIFSRNEIIVDIGNDTQVVFNVFAQAGVHLGEGESFQSSEVLASRIDKYTPRDASAEPDSGPDGNTNTAFIRSHKGELFNFRLDEQQVEEVHGSDGDEILDATQVAESSQAGSDDSADSADHKLWLYGRAGNDTLKGNADGVYLDGGLGNDLIEAGRGRNFITGGEGQDEYVLQLETSSDEDLKSDLLYDYTSVEGHRDLIDLQHILPLDATAENIHSYVKVTDMGIYVDVTGEAKFDKSNELGRWGERVDIDNLITLRLADGSSIELDRENALSEFIADEDGGLLRGGLGSDILRGQSGDDVLDGDGLSQEKSADHLYGGEGNDQLTVDGLDLTLGTVDGGSGYDTARLQGATGESLNLDLKATGIERAFGGFSDDVLDGSGYTEQSGYNRNTGEFEDDSAQRLSLYGKYGDDTLIGGVGNDYLDGGQGDDVISGGQGRDFLSGGAGNDTFILSDDGEVDTLWDFTSDDEQTDVLDISALVPEDFDMADLDQYLKIDNEFVYFDQTGQGQFTYGQAVAKFGDHFRAESPVSIVLGDGMTIVREVNSAPTVTTALLTGGVTELADGSGSENILTLSDSGFFTIADVDLTDVQTVSITSDTTGYLGTFTTTISNNTTGDGAGRVDWTFSISDADLGYMAEHEMVFQSYTVTVDDGKGGTVDQKVTVSIVGSNDAPVVSVDTQTGQENETIMIDVLANDTDEDSDSSNFSLDSVQIVDGDGNPLSGHGSVSIVDNQLQFVPGSDFDSLTEGESTTIDVRYVMSDGDGGFSESTAIITVIGTNDAPTAVADLDSINLTENSAVVVGSLITDTDATDIHTFNILNQPSEGSVSILPNNLMQFALDGDSADTGYASMDGITNDGVSYVQDSERGTVAEFNNEGMITLAEGDNVADGLPADAMTVAGWVKLESADTWGGFFGLIQDTGSYEKGWMLGTRNQQFSFALKSDGNEALTYLTDDAASFELGQWYHVAASYDGATMNLYVNGELVVSSTDQGGAIDYPPSGKFEIGSYYDDNENYGHDGRLDDMRLYDTALTDVQIKQVMEGQQVGDYRFEPDDDFQDLDPGETRDVSFTYEAVDHSGDSVGEPGTVSITVTGTDSAPVARVSANLMIDVLANDTDEDSDSSNFSLESVQIVDSDGNPLSGQGTVSIVNNQLQFSLGSDFDYLDHGETATVTVRYVMSDDAGLTSESTAVITVNGPNDAPVVFGLVAATPETKVNDGTTTGDQSDVRVESADNGAITVWASAESDGSAIRAKLPDGTEIKVNETNPSDSEYFSAPEVAVLDSGNFAVTWELHDSEGGVETFMRVFAADGTEVKSEFQVSTGECSPSLLALSNDQFLALASDPADSYHLGGGIYSNDGTYLVGGILEVDGAAITTGSWQDHPYDVVALDNGGFAVAWRDTSSSNGDTAALVIYDSNADNIMGPVHYGGSNPTSRERTGIERLASGDLVTTYQDGNDLYFQRWDGGSLDAYGSPVKINTGDGLNGRLAVQALDDGGFFVVWSSSQDGDESGVYGRQFDAKGNALTDEILINTTIVGNQFEPDITLQADGNVLITWTSDHGVDADIYSATLDVSNHQVNEGAANGTVVGELLVHDEDGGANLTYALIDDADGRFAINSTTGEITVTNGDLLDYETDRDYILRVQVTDSDGLSSEQGVVVNVMDIDDALVAVGAEQHIGSITTGGQESPAFTPLADGGFMAVWHDEVTDQIKAQRYNYTQTREVAIGDHSFESVALADGTWSTQPTGGAWTFSNGSGTQNLEATNLTAEASDGENVVWINDNNSSISQTLSETFQRSNDYTLKVDVGNRQDFSGMVDYTVRVSAGGVVLASDGSITPGEGDFATLTLNIDGRSISEGSAAIGQPLTIELIKNGDSSSGFNQAVFDNVRMTVTEPTLELTPFGDEFQINTVEPTSNQDVLTPEIATLDNGNYAVVWGLIQPGGWYNTRMRVFDADGNEVKAEFSAGTEHYATDITAISDNRFATVSVDSSDSFSVKIHIFDASGNETSVISAGSAGSWGYGAPDIEALSDGGFVVSWRSNSTENDSASFRIYDASGNPATDAISFGGPPPADDGVVKIQELDNGELVTVYQSGDDLFFQRWDSTGTAIGSATAVNTTTTDDLHQFNIEALPDGGFFVVWRSDGQDGDGQGIVGRRFDASGTAVTDEVVINSTTDGDQFDPQVTLLDDGTLEVLWTSNHTGNDEIFGSTVTIQPHREVYGSDDVNDTLDGTMVDESIYGFDGNDTLNAGGGDDLLVGGAGDDILTGGSGEDVFEFNFDDIGTAAQPAEDLITDFQTGPGGDVIDISDLLSPGDSLDNYLSVSLEGSDTVLEVKSDSGDVTQKITLEGVDLSGYGGGTSDMDIINNLIDDGNLQV